MFPHFVHGRTGATIPFRRKDDGADVVETTFLFQGMICAREYFAGETTEEARLRCRVNALLSDAEWEWFTREERRLYWHWSPRHGWAMDTPIIGWNECLLAFVLAAGSPRHAIDPEIFHESFAAGPGFRNGRDHYGIVLPLGVDLGGPLFFSHYSFCGLDPRGLADRHANYWNQNVAQTRINYLHCVINPHNHMGYGPDCWGLTSSHGPRGYVAHAPDRDLGVITPRCGAVQLSLRTAGSHVCLARLPRQAEKAHLGSLRVRGRLLREPELVFPKLSGDQSGADRGDDREPSNGASVEPFHERAGSAPGFGTVGLHQPASYDIDASTRSPQP